MEEKIEMDVKDFFVVVGELYMQLRHAQATITRMKLQKETNVVEPEEETNGRAND